MFGLFNNSKRSFTDLLRWPTASSICFQIAPYPNGSLTRLFVNGTVAVKIAFRFWLSALKTFANMAKNWKAGVRFCVFSVTFLVHFILVRERERVLWSLSSYVLEQFID